MLKAKSKPTVLFFERLETPEDKLRAKGLQLNATLTREDFRAARAQARQIDEDLRRINEEEPLDPEVQE
jgi:hypothetical protein